MSEDNPSQNIDLSKLPEDSFASLDPNNMTPNNAVFSQSAVGSSETSLDLGVTPSTGETVSEDEHSSELVEDPSMAHEMALSLAPSMQAIENIKNSDMQDKDEVIKALSENLDDLASKAKERYVEAEKNYKLARDYALTNLALVIQGGASLEDMHGFKFGDIVTFSDFDSTGSKVLVGDGSVATLDKERTVRLRNDIYSILGAKAPDLVGSQFYNPGSNYTQIIGGSLKLEKTDFIEHSPKYDGIKSNDLQIAVRKFN